MVAASESAAPNSAGEFSTFASAPFSPILNNVGQAAFFARLTGSSNGLADDTGLFRGDGSVIIQIAREGQAPPHGVGTLSTFSIPSQNDLGQVAFRSQIDNPGAGFSDAGIYRGDGNMLTEIARAWQIVPDGNGRLSTFGNAYINNSGQVSFRAGLVGTNNQGEDDGAIFLGSGNSLTQLVREGQLAPGGGVFSQLGDPALNDMGRITFSASLVVNGGDSNNGGIFVADGALLAEVVRAGQPTPDGRGEFSLISHYSSNNSGQVLFTAQVSDSGMSNDFGVFLEDGGVIVQLAREGQSSPLANSKLNFSDWMNLPPPVLNGAGQAAFLAGISLGSGLPATEYAIIRASGAIQELIAGSGQSAPGGGQFSGVGSFSLNDSGQIVFLASVTDAVSPGDADAIYLFDDSFGLMEVARVGDPLDGSTIAGITFSFESPVNWNGITPLNQNGQVAYQFSLDDGRSGIAIATLIPEPGTIMHMLWAIAALVVYGTRCETSANCSTRT